MKAYTLFILIFVCSTGVFAQTLEEQVNTFLTSLNAKQRKAVSYSYDDRERLNWHYVPRSRNGIALFDLTEAQRAAVFRLLEASLSRQGYTKAQGIIALENILRVVEGRETNDAYRNPLNYAITIFGVPSTINPWGWRLEGHHISLNFTSIDGVVASSTPSFFGANPATVPSGKDAGRQTLKLEKELAFTLLNSLTENQKSVAIISTKSPFDIMTGNSERAKQPETIGISFKALDDAQKKLFLQLLDVYVKNYVFDFSSRLMDKITKAGIDNLSFAWAGSTQGDAGHYYRIQGPMLLIEYDNTQNNANHIHSVVRDLTNDFAEDILREHYKKEHTH